jgi:hypothetical protein
MRYRVGDRSGDSWARGMHEWSLVERFLSPAASSLDRSSLDTLVVSHHVPAILSS